MKMRALVASLCAIFAWSPTSGVAAPVEAGAVTSVTVEAPLYDSKLREDGGCDPAGCVGGNTRDGSLAPVSRWSCKGSACTITYNLGGELNVVGINVALYKGDERTRTMDVKVDGAKVTTWTSSGVTLDFESIDLGVAGQVVELTGVLADSDWLSITEVEILVDDGTTPPPSPTTPIVTPTPTVATPEQLYSAKEVGTIGTVTVAADLFDPKLYAANGCDPDGCTAALTRDGDLADKSRWSCSPQLGGECTITYDLGEEYSFQELRLAMFRGTTRQRTVSITVDGTLVRNWESSGTTDDFEVVDLTGNDGGLLGNLASSGVSGQVVQITGQLGRTEWLSIKETEILVYPKNVVTPPPAPTAPPTPALSPLPGAAPIPVPPLAPEPVSPTPTGDFQPVGLLPLAWAVGTNLEKSYIKDSDLSTTWSCTGDVKASDDPYYDCRIGINLVSFRHVKQVKIALSDGTGAVDIRIASSWYTEDDRTVAFVTSSGSADGFETYDFDAFTDYIHIAPVFGSNGQTFSVSEVEILEEVQPGEVTVTDFDTPYDNGDGLWTGPITNGFDWSSDSDEALDRTLSWPLSSYATMDAIELQFPVGDTYKFDLQLFDDSDDPVQVFPDLESQDAEGWQSFDVSSYAGHVIEITLVIKGTGSGAPGFKLLDARLMGASIDNPTDTFVVGSTLIESWGSQRYADFVSEGTGDQKAINAAICAVKKADYDGVDCVGGDDAATGEVQMNFGEWFVDGPIVMKSGVFLNARYSIDDSPYVTDIFVEEGAAGITDVDAVVVMDGISDARIDDLWIRGRYDPESDAPAVSGFGSVGLSIVGSTNITCIDTEIRYCDGDGLVVRNSQGINIDAGAYDDEYLPWTIGISRGTGILVDSSDAVWVRRHTVYDNGVAGIHVMGSNNFTFEATIADECWPTDDCVIEGEGNVGSVDGQQPIEVIIEDSTDVKFTDTRVQSANDPVMTVSASTGVSFDNCGFSNVESGTCVIKVLDTDSAVVTGGDPELSLQDTTDGPCWVKV
eukprot:g17154.t1